MLKRWSRGQALTEFAIILPTVLVTMFLIIETGRIFQAYVTAQNAARVGARYAVTGRGGAVRADNIKTAAKDILGSGLPLLDDPSCSDYCCDSDYLPEHYCITVWSRGGYDAAGLPGERVQIQVIYNVRVITPILSLIAPYVPVTGRVEMINEPFGPTGQAQGGVVPPALDLPPTFTPTFTLTPTSTPVPVTISEPLRPGDTFVTGHADPDYETLITIWDWTTRQIIGSGQMQPDGTFRVAVTPGLIAENTIRAIGDYTYDDAVVGAATSTPTETPTFTPTPTSTATFTPTATGTSTPTPTATPTPYNISVTCGDNTDYTDGEGHLWQADQPYSAGSWGHTGLVDLESRDRGGCASVAGTADKDLYNSYTHGEFMTYYFDNVTNGEYQVTLLFVEPDPNWEGDREFDVAIEGSLVLDDLDIYTEAGQCTAYPRSFTTTVNDGLLEIDLAPYWGEAIISGIDVSFTAYPPTPTPTTAPTNTPTNTPTPTSTPVVPPDLKITDLSVPGGQPITDCWTPVDVTSDVTNASTGPCNEFFWTDLYVYTDTVGPPPPNQAGVAWQGLGSLGPSTSTTITFTHSFVVSGTHYLYAQADSFQFVSETDETNNVGGPVTVTVACVGTPPTPTPTPTPDPACGSISGTVWAFIGGQLVVPTDRVDMSLTESGFPIDQTLTDLAGRYTFDCVPEGSGYSVRGTLDIDGTLYWGTESGIQVLPSQPTGNIDIILYPS